MTRPLAALALAAALAAGCGGAREQSRQPGQASARGGRGEGARDEGAGQRGMAGAHRGEAGEAGKAPRVPASPEALLGRDTVGRLQQALAQRGLLGQHQPGGLDAPTRAAVRRFQEQQGLAATGVPDKQTLRDLGVGAEEAYGPGHGGRG